MKMATTWSGALALAALISLPLQAAEPVKVGSKIDTEGALLGNMIQQVLESHGVKTINKIQLGTTPVVRGAIVAGELDIYPEYTGNGAFFFKDENDPAWKNAQQGYEKVKRLDQEKHQLVWLTPAPANNTWTIAVRQDLAEKNKLTSLADLSRYLKQGGEFKLAASAEFIERPDALPAFEKAYGFNLNQNQLLSLAGGDTAVTIKAAAQQTSGVNAAMAYGTDGPVAALGLQTLSDPQGVQPIYAPTPVVREAVLKAYPQIADWLQPVFASLDEKTLQQLNARIAVEGQDAKRVAPALIALTLYALLPLVRGVVTGLQQVPQDALESATAMGMSAGQRFRQVQLPLAMPVLLRSLRVVSVQTVGMAVVAALIGAGGFGALVFQGLLSSALDLVLLGVVPTIALAVVVDALFALWGAWLKGEVND